MKEFYDANDIQVITGVKMSKAYEIIRSLNERFKKEFKGALTIKGKVPIWYFNEKFLGIKKEQKNDF